MISPKIFKIASDNKYQGLANIYTHRSLVKNSKCGDKIKLEIIVKNKKIRSIRYETDSCLFCQASASILANKVKSLSIMKLKKDLAQLSKIFKKKKTVLPIKYKSFKELINKDNIGRFDCIMLPIKALTKALKL